MHTFINARDRSVSLELYGRRLYEVMRVWETSNRFACGVVHLEYAVRT